MSQTVDPFAKLLPGLPKKPLTPEQQLDALSRVQSQAESRVALGLKLFKAAENHTRSQQNMLDELKIQQQELRDQVNEDVARSLHTYDQWVGKMDENFTNSLQKLEEKIEMLQENWMATQQRIETMLERSAELFSQASGVTTVGMEPAIVEQVTPQPIENIQRTAPQADTTELEADDDVIPMPQDMLETPVIDQEQPLEIADDQAETQDPADPQTQARLKPESGSMYTDLLRQLRQQAEDKNDAV